MEIAEIDRHTRDAMELASLASSLIGKSTVYSNTALTLAANYISGPRFNTEEENREFIEALTKFFKSKIL